MLKTIKLPERGYNNARKLAKDLEEEETMIGIYKVNISTAVCYALEKILEERRKRRKFLAAAGSWADVDAKKMIREIYEGRSKGRTDISFD